MNRLSDLSIDTAAEVVAAAQRLRQPDDLLIASVHWGGNWGYAVAATHRAFAHALIDGGFALVHGHSSHHPRGIELYRGHMVLYGCGDFINDYEGIGGYEDFRSDLTLMYLPRVGRRRPAAVAASGAHADPPVPAEPALASRD